MIEISLLGKPKVEINGTWAPARGRKPWGLLAYLLTSEVAISRSRLSELLFGEAEDPLAALRWNLAELRRLLGDASLLRGDPLHLELSPQAVVDVRVLTRGTWVEAVKLPGLDHELLAGTSFPDNPAFETWLLTERRHLAGVADAVLREAALAQLAAGQPGMAIPLARRLVEHDVFSEEAHALLIRAYRASGDGAGARSQFQACTDILKRELGIEPGPAVTAALELSPDSLISAPVGGRAAARAQLQAGEAAVSAGVLEPGLECLRRAAAEAHACGDPELKAQALMALASALVHAARGRDEEGAGALHEVLAIAERTGDVSLAARARRELGYAAMLRGRYERAEIWLAEAAALAADDHAERGWALHYLGMARSDVARYPEALANLEEAVELAGLASDAKLQAFALSSLGRIHLLRGDAGLARQILESALTVVENLGWTAFRPWPAALYAELELADGKRLRAWDMFEETFALACQLGDPCWEAMAQRGLGLMADPAEGPGRLSDARTRSVRLPDTYLWVEAYCLDALCTRAVETGFPGARAWISDLEALAARTGMREMSVRACLHRAASGDRAAAAAAKALAVGIESPLLQALVEAA